MMNVPVEVRRVKHVQARRFSLGPLLAQHVPAPVASLLAPPLEHLLALRRLDRFYAAVGPAGTPAQFAQRALNMLGVRFALQSPLSALVPASGPLVVVANHPYGGIEGLFLISLLARQRPDLRILANELLGQIPELAAIVLPVDVFGGRAAAERNARSMRSALQWVRRGGTLVVFPAGEVSHAQAPGGVVTDPPWHASVGRLAQLSGAPVLPVFFSGANGATFQVAGRVHPRVRTALLPRELLARREREIGVTAGSLIPSAVLAAIEDPEDVTRHLRLATYALAMPDLPRLRRAAPPRRREIAPIAPALAPADLAAEIASLSASSRLAASGDLVVHRLRFADAPRVLQEIGRLRELTFRKAGEGTGQPRDLDAFDQYYDHLVLWNDRLQEVVGGYRLGDVAGIRSRHGLRGLYTHQLFEYRDSLLRAVDPALELGRSFIRSEYQRSFTPLLLLWKAIASHVATDARHRVLFGPVSLSNDYTPAAKLLITEYLRTQQSDPQLARLVRGRSPPRERQACPLLCSEAAGIRSIDVLDRIVAQLEPDGKGIPVLLRQYLRLGGRVIGFNVDAAFGDAIDCLIVVDLQRTAPQLLAKYMGREAAARYLQSRTGSLNDARQAA